MPTPATHLTVAEEMLRGDDLAAPARRLLRRQQGAFMLGHTAPDVRAVSGQSREACHFYTVPRTSDQPAYQALFDAHPSLRRVGALSPPRLAFVAGYIAHLLLDELWLDDVFQHFVLQDWGLLSERLFLHNVLRTWIDHRAQEALRGTVAQMLRRTKPQAWLPFVDDEHLLVWRDWLVEQLTSDRGMETAEVLAGRMGIPPDEIESVARSSARMERRVFRHFPLSALQSFRQRGYRRSVALVNWYMGGVGLRQTWPAPAHLPAMEEARL